MTESLLDQETAGQPVAFIGVQRVRFLFLIRASEFLLDQVKPGQKILDCGAVAGLRLSSRD